MRLPLMEKSAAGAIQLITCETRKACAEFNGVRATHKMVAALHMTCRACLETRPVLQ